MSLVLEHLLSNSEALGSNSSTKNNNKKSSFLLLSLFLRSEMKTLCMGWVCMWCPLKLPQKSSKLETIIVCTLKVRKFTKLSTVKEHTIALEISSMLNDLTVPDLLFETHTYTLTRTQKTQQKPVCRWLCKVIIM